MNKTRIQVYADPRLKRRVELAAAKRDVPVTEYCLEAIIQRLAEDEVLEAEQIVIDLDDRSDGALLSELMALHERILADRNGVPVDTSDLLEEVRYEREAELVGRLR